MNCPKHNRTPYNEFLTPQNEDIISVANYIASDNFNQYLEYVNENIEYIRDKISCGYSDCWSYPSETLQNGYGDCEDMSFLLASLLMAKFKKNSIRVVIGWHNRNGHAWVEIVTKDKNELVLESTSGEWFDKVTAYRNGYVSDVYVYLNGCEKA
jgi:predicted transglutaminase-like cysteine proteinase